MYATDNKCLKIIVSGDKIEYFILLNSEGGKSGPAERLKTPI